MRALAAAVFALFALAATGCGGCGDDDEKPKPVTGVTGTSRVTTPSTAPAAAAFRRHAAAAVTALREGVEEPFRHGDFEGDPVQLISALAKAGSSLQTAVRELNAAVDVASGPNGVPALAAQAESLLGHIPALISSARDGNLDTDELTQFLDELDAMGRTASAGGIDVPATTTPTTPGVTVPGE